MRRSLAALSLIAAVTAPTAKSSGQRITQGCWDVNTSTSTLTVHVYPGGLFSPALHEHQFVPRKWQGQVCFPQSDVRQLSVDIRVASDSLQDRQRALSEEDRRTVQRQVREDVLQAAQHPEIRFTAGRFEIESSGDDRASGVVRGYLSLRGRRRNVDVPVQAVWSGDRLRVAGDVRFKQSDFGIEPYSRFLGTVSVKDEVRVEFAVEAEPPGIAPLRARPAAL